MSKKYVNLIIFVLLLVASIGFISCNHSKDISNNASDKSQRNQINHQPFHIIYNGYKSMNEIKYLPKTHMLGQSTQLSNPIQRNGYQFAGWYTNKQLMGEPITVLQDKQVKPKLTEDGQNKVENNTIHLYGCWIPNQYNILYNLNGGTFSKLDSSVEHKNQIKNERANTPHTKYNEKPLPKANSSKNMDDLQSPTKLHTYGKDTILAKPTRVGYKFIGWFDNVNCKGKPLHKLKGDKHTKAINLYAGWKSENYKINYVDITAEQKIHIMGNTNYSIDKVERPHLHDTKCKICNQLSPETKKLPTIYHYESPLQLPKVQKLGYTFVGWFDNADFLGHPLCELSAQKYTQNITLYAKFIPKSYPIDYELNGGEFDQPINSGITPTMCTLDETIDLPIPTKQGHTFIGWHNNVQLQGQPMTTLSVAQIPSTKIILFAKWQANAYNIFYYLDDSILGIAPTLHTFGTETILPKPIKAGYKFLGWYDNAQWLGTPIESLSTQYVQDIFLYANFAKIEYKINYHLDGGTLQKNSPLVHTYGKDSILVDPVKQDYEFVGWYDKSEMIGNQINYLNGYEYFDEIDLYAKWDKE